MQQNLTLWARRTAKWLFLPALAVVIWGELKPSTHGPEVIWDKLLHFIAYFGLAGIATVALADRVRAIAASALALAVFGGILEIVQSFVGRDAEWGDEAANIVGVFAGSAAALMLLRLLQRPGQP
jgi:VanZ family protein